MKTAAGRLGRYVFWQALGGIAIAAIVTLSAIMLVDVVEQIRLVGTRSELSLGSAVRLTALRAPFLFEQTLPFVVLAGVLFAMVVLTRRNEITVMRAGGVSPWGLAAPAVALAMLIGISSTALLGPFGVKLQQRYEAERNALINPGSQPGANVWLSQGDANSQIVLRAESADPQRSVLNTVTVFMFYVDSEHRRRFLRRLDAREAHLVPGAWELRDVKEASPFEPPAHQDQVRIPTTLGQDVFSRAALSPEFTSVYALPKAIENAKLAGLKPRRYEVRLHSLLATPLLLAAMALIAVVFSSRLHRLGGVAAWVVVGICTGFATYFLGQVSEALASIGAAPPMAAGWGPPLAALFAASAALVAGESRKA